jgi:hypothetical protein
MINNIKPHICGVFAYSLVSIKKPCNGLKPLDLSLAIQFQLKSLRVEGKQGGVGLIEKD